jgi:N utilization substance protein A
LGEGIIQKLVAAGITTVEGLADMTPEQLEEIPGIGEKTLERISVAVRHYFGQFEEGEEAPATESAEADGASPGTGMDSADASAETAQATEDENRGTVSVEKAVREKPGKAEKVNADAAVDLVETESENSREVIEEAGFVRGAEAENAELDHADARSEALAEELAESENITEAELAIENVPTPEDVDPLDRE